MCGVWCAECRHTHTHTLHSYHGMAERYKYNWHWRAHKKCRRQSRETDANRKRNGEQRKGDRVRGREGGKRESWEGERKTKGDHTVIWNAIWIYLAQHINCTMSLFSLERMLSARSLYVCVCVCVACAYVCLLFDNMNLVASDYIRMRCAMSLCILHVNVRARPKQYGSAVCFHPFS